MTFANGHVPSHKGRSTTVDPIKNLDDLSKVKALVLPDVRLNALWHIATNTALRASDLVSLKFSDVQTDGTLVVRERKTAKRRVIPLNSSTLKALRVWEDHATCDYIFSGQRGAMTVGSWSRIVKSLCEQAGLEGQFGSHSCRKTFVRLQCDVFKTSLPVLMSLLGHSTEKQTLVYCGKLQDEVVKAYSHAL